MQQIGDKILITVNEWTASGLTIHQFKKDRLNGYLNIYRRGIRGNTLIDFNSIQRPDRLASIEAYLRKQDNEIARHDAELSALRAQVAELKDIVLRLARANLPAGTAAVVSQPVQQNEDSIFQMDGVDLDARSEYLKFRKDDGSTMTPAQITEYTNRASILMACVDALERTTDARAKSGKKPIMGTFYKNAAAFFLEQAVNYPCQPITEGRSFERVFKKFLKGTKISKKAGYLSLINENMNNDSRRKVSEKTKNLILAMWGKYDKPFVDDVHRDYLALVRGDEEFFDKETGEIYSPKDFRYKDKPLELSKATIWNYCKKAPNYAAVYGARNGNFDYVNKMRPKHTRENGKFALSKVTMDDVAMSRKCSKGWVYKYVATDVVSEYMFRPAYVVGKPTIATVTETHRNMFRELIGYGLPKPYELDCENHLMRDIDWLDKVWDKVTFNTSATSKRQENFNRLFKYGVSKKNGHTNMRWYGKSEAYSSPRVKEKGDFVEKEYDRREIVEDDLRDIEEWNNQLHPLQRTYPGMTRKDVLLQHYNKNLLSIEPWYLFKFFGEKTETSIVNNNRLTVQYHEYWLKDNNSLNLLKPNNYVVDAYYLRDNSGDIETIYLYQGDKYIGEAEDMANKKYNECFVERTAEDEANLLWQEKKISKYDKFVKEIKANIPVIGSMKADTSRDLDLIRTDIVEGVQPKGVDGWEPEENEYETMDYAALGLSQA